MSGNRQSERLPTDYRERLTREERKSIDGVVQKLLAFISHSSDDPNYAGHFPSSSQLSARKKALKDYFPIALRLFSDEGRKDANTSQSSENSNETRPVKADRETIFHILTIAALYPLNMSEEEAKRPPQSLACATWLLDYFFAYETRKKRKHARDLTDDEEEIDAEDDGEIIASADESPDDEQPDLWLSFIGCLAQTTSDVPDYCPKYASDTAYPQYLINRAAQVLDKRYDIKEHADCAKAFQRIMAMIDEDTKERLRELYYRNVNGMVAAALRLEARGQEEEKRLLRAVAPTRGEEAAFSPPPGSPVMSSKQPLNAVGFADRDISPVAMKNIVDSMRSSLGNIEVEAIARAYESSKAPNYTQQFLTKGPIAINMNDDDAMEVLRYKAVFQELSTCFSGDPYDLCMAYLLLESERDSIINLDAINASILIYAHSRLPWDVDDIDADLFVVEHGVQDYSLRYVENMRYIEQQNCKFDKTTLPPDPPFILPDDYEEPYLPARDIELSQSDEEWIKKSRARKLNYQQLFFLVTGLVLPRKTKVSRDVIDYVKAQGATDDVAHEIAAMSALTQSLSIRDLLDTELMDEDAETDCEYDEAGDGDDDEQNPFIQVEKLKAELARMRVENGNLEKKLSDMRGSLLDAEREKKRLVDRAAKEKEKFEDDRAELAELREFVFSLKNDYAKYGEEDADGDERYQFPYDATLRIVVFGGHTAWRKMIKPMLPNVRFYEQETLSSPDVVRNADVVFIQSNAIGHKFFNVVMDEARRSRTEYHYLMYASARKCAEQICERDMKSLR
ncbi:MAG: hypothetical protein Q4D04_05840 [Clostridia bacterium]|nr:hypothetical protein [Clostridia bacterium]